MTERRTAMLGSMPGRYRGRPQRRWGFGRLGSGRCGRAALGSNDGAGAVEFALLVPVFVVLVMGALQFGWILFVRHELYAAAQQVCRQLALGADDANSATAALQDEMQRLGAQGTIRVVAPTPAVDALVEIRVPMARLVWTELFRPMVGTQEIQVRVVYRSASRTSAAARPVFPAGPLVARGRGPVREPGGGSRVQPGGAVS